MTQPAHQPEPTPDQQGGDTAAVATLLLTSTSVALLAAAIYALLRRRGRRVSRQSVAMAVALGHARTRTKPRMVGSSSAVRAQREVEASYRAAYIISAAERIELAGSQAAGSAGRAMRQDLPVGNDQAADVAARTARETAMRAAAARERSYEAAHERARKRRMAAARVVHEASQQYGDMLGWYSHRDDRVTPECLLADGSNFRASRPPIIGNPGTLHGGTCRCAPGPPHPGGPDTDVATGMTVPSGRRTG